MVPYEELHCKCKAFHPSRHTFQRSNHISQRFIEQKHARQKVSHWWRLPLCSTKVTPIYNCLGDIAACLHTVVMWGALEKSRNCAHSSHLVALCCGSIPIDLRRVFKFSLLALGQSYCKVQCCVKLICLRCNNVAHSPDYCVFTFENWYRATVVHCVIISNRLSVVWCSLGPAIWTCLGQFLCHGTHLLDQNNDTVGKLATLWIHVQSDMQTWGNIPTKT